MGVVVQLSARAGVKRPLVQILVVVANIQMRTLKAEVGKGSTRTAIGRGLVAPKRWVKTANVALTSVAPGPLERESG